MEQVHILRCKVRQQRSPTPLTFSSARFTIEIQRDPYLAPLHPTPHPTKNVALDTISDDLLTLKVSEVKGFYIITRTYILRQGEANRCCGYLCQLPGEVFQGIGTSVDQSSTSFFVPSLSSGRFPSLKKKKKKKNFFTS